MPWWAEAEVYLHSFLTPALYGGEWPNSRPGRLIPKGREPGARWPGGLVGLIAGLDVSEESKIYCLRLESKRDFSVVQPAA